MNSQSPNQNVIKKSISLAPASFDYDQLTLKRIQSSSEVQQIIENSRKSQMHRLDGTLKSVMSSNNTAKEKSCQNLANQTFLKVYGQQFKEKEHIALKQFHKITNKQLKHKTGIICPEISYLQQAVFAEQGNQSRIQKDALQKALVKVYRESTSQKQDFQSVLRSFAQTQRGQEKSRQSFNISLYSDAKAPTQNKKEDDSLASISEMGVDQGEIRESMFQKIKSSLHFGDLAAIQNEDLKKQTSHVIKSPGRRYSDEFRELQKGRSYALPTLPDFQTKMKPNLKHQKTLNPRLSITNNRNSASGLSFLSILKKTPKTGVNSILRQTFNVPATRLIDLSKKSQQTPSMGRQSASETKDFNINVKNVKKDAMFTSNKSDASELEELEQVRKGAKELLEDIFGERLEEGVKTYTKKEVLELADFDCSNDSSKAKSGSISSEGSSDKVDSKAERKMLILELLDNIFQSQFPLSKAQILEGIFEQIKGDRYFQEQSEQYSSPVSGNVQFDGIKAIRSPSSSSGFEEASLNLSKRSKSQQFLTIQDQSPIKQIQQQRDKKRINSIYSNGKHIEILNLNKKRFQVKSHDDQLINLDQIKRDKMFEYSDSLPKSNVNIPILDEIEENMVEIQHIFQKISGEKFKDNSYQFVRVNEILIKFFYKIENFDQSLVETQNHLTKSKQDLINLNNQFQELKFVKENEQIKNKMSINYNEQLINDLNFIENENANFQEQRDMLIRENQSLKLQISEIEDNHQREMKPVKVVSAEESFESVRNEHQINFNSGSFGGPNFTSQQQSSSQYIYTQNDVNKLKEQITELEKEAEFVNQQLVQVKVKQVVALQNSKNQISELQQLYKSLLMDNDFLKIRNRSLLEESKIINEEKQLKRKSTAINIQKMKSSNSLMQLEVNNEYFKQQSNGQRYSHASQEEIKLSSHHSQSMHDFNENHFMQSEKKEPMSLPRERVKSLLTKENETQAQDDVDLAELMEQRNQQIQIHLLESSSISNLLSDMPKFDSQNAQSYQQFSFTLMKQQDFMLNQISSMQKQIERLHQDYQEQLKEIHKSQKHSSNSACTNCVTLYQRIEALQKQLEKKKKKTKGSLISSNSKSQAQRVKTIEIKVDKSIKKVELSNKKASKKLNLNESVSSLNSWRSRQQNVNASLYYSTGKKISGSKSLNKSQFKIPVHQNTVYGVYNFKLEQNDYREKLKYLIQKNKNIKKMYQLDLTTSEQKKLQERRRMIIESGKLRSMPLQLMETSFGVMKKVKRTKSAPNLLSVDANCENNGSDKLIHSAKIKYRKTSNYDFSQDDMRVSNESEEQHNHPAMPRIKQKELDANMQQILQKHHNYNLICQPNSEFNQDGGLKIQNIIQKINLCILAKKTIGQITSMEEQYHERYIDLENLQGPDKMKLYTERVHIYINSKLKECLMVIFEGLLHFIKIDGTKLIFPHEPPLDITKDLSQVLKCMKSYTYKSYQKETYQYFALAIKKQQIIEKGFSQSHIIIVQQERRNFEKLIDFINFAIYRNCNQTNKEIIIQKKSLFEKFDIFINKNKEMKSEMKSFCFEDIGYYRIQNLLLKKVILQQQTQLKDVILKQINGKISNHWVNCQIELKQPNQYAQQILQDIQNLDQSEHQRQELERDIKLFMILNFGPNFLQDFRVNASSKQEQQIKIDKYLQKFMHILEMKTGAANISQNIVSEIIVLNHSMKIKSVEPLSQNEASNEQNQKLWFQLQVDNKVHNFAAISSSSPEHRAIFDKWLKCLQNTQTTLSSQLDQRLKFLKQMIEQLLQSYKGLSPTKNLIKDIAAKYKTATLQSSPDYDSLMMQSSQMHMIGQSQNQSSQKGDKEWLLSSQMKSRQPMNSCQFTISKYESPEFHEIKGDREGQKSPEEKDFTDISVPFKDLKRERSVTLRSQHTMRRGVGRLMGPQHLNDTLTLKQKMKEMYETQNSQFQSSAKISNFSSRVSKQ